VVMSSNQEQVLRDARLRHRILAALSQASETLPPTVALNLRPLLQQGQTFVGSVSSAVLRDGLQQVSALIAEGVTADGLLPMLDQRTTEHAAYRTDRGGTLRAAYPRLVGRRRLGGAGAVGSGDQNHH
jgi:hypothetical protein